MTKLELINQLAKPLSENEMLYFKSTEGIVYLNDYFFKLALKHYDNAKSKDTILVLVRHLNAIRSDLNYLYSIQNELLALRLFTERVYLENQELKKEVEKLTKVLEHETI